MSAPNPPARNAPTGVTVRGAATPEELAAVLAVLGGARVDGASPSRYQQWRRVRREALRRAPEAADGPI